MGQWIGWRIILRLTHILAGLLVFSSISIAQASTSTPFKILSSTRNPLVWQRFDQWLMITEDLTTGRVCYFYSPQTGTKMSLKDPLVGSWVPLGAAIKWLMYVDHVNGLDRLISHDVDSQNWHITKPSTNNQVGCGMVGNICWFGEYRAATVNGITPVDLYTADVSSGEISAVCVSDSQKSLFAHDGNLLIYKAQYSSSTTRLCGRYFDGTGEFLIEHCSPVETSVCGNLVAWAVQSGSGWYIMAKNLASGEVRSVAYTTASPPHPQAGENTLFWEDARNSASTGIDIYGYDWRTGEEFVVTNAAGNQYGLRVCDDLITWVTGPTNYQILWGAWLQPYASRVVDLRPDLIEGLHADLSWTAVGTSSNRAVSYELRAGQSAVTDSNWDQADIICTVTSSAAPGSSVSAAWNASGYGCYFIAAKATFADGTHSNVSNCIKVYLLSDAREAVQLQGGYVGFMGTVTGIGMDRSIYIQHGNGVPSVRALIGAQDIGMETGDIVTVTGICDADSEFFGPLIREAVIKSKSSAGEVKKFAMNNKALGGSAAGYKGASNVWMPVRVWGRVSDLSCSNGCTFRLNDGSTNEGVNVVCPFTPPSELINGCRACVEGICRVSRDSGREIEVVESGRIEIY